MSARRVMTLIRQLPSSSRLNCRVSGDETGQRWGPLEHLLADLIDQGQAARIEARVIAGDKRPPAMKPYPRPGASAREGRDQDAANARARALLPGMTSSSGLASRSDPRAVAALPGSRPGGG